MGMFRVILNSLERKESRQLKPSSNSGIKRSKITIIILSLVFVVVSVNVVYADRISISLPQSASAQSDTWYVGKGLEPNTYYTYEIRQFDTNQGRPFLMTIYFKEFDSNNNI